MRRVVSVLFMMSLWLAMPMTVSATAGAKQPVLLPASVQEAVAPAGPLKLLGYGNFSKLLWDVFDASLWVAGSQWTEDQPYALEIRYAREFKGSDIVDGTRDQWQHLGLTDSAKVNPWLKRLSGIFPDIKQGDQLVGLYLPGRETRFFHNGKPIGTVSDPDFGKAFFAIWLDPKSSEPTLRDELLGIRCAKPQTVAYAQVNACSDATMSGPSTRRSGSSRP